MVGQLDSKQAQELAIRFLEQHHSTIKTENVTLEDGVWIVEVLVSAPHNRKFRVKVNAKTGYVLGWQ